jgi:hypothetical protein
MRHRRLVIHEVADEMIAVREAVTTSSQRHGLPMTAIAFRVRAKPAVGQTRGRLHIVTRP